MIDNEAFSVHAISSHFQTNLDRLPETVVPDFPLTSQGIEDFSSILQSEDGREDADYLATLPDLVAMCRAVSRSEVPLIYNPAIRGYHSISSIRDLRSGIEDAPDDAIFWDLPTNGERGRCGAMESVERETSSGGVSYMHHVQRVGGCVCGGRSHYGFLRRYHCDRPQCPDWHCLIKWAMDRAEDGADRLIGADYLMNDSCERLMHVVLSFDPDADKSWMFSRNAFNKKMREVYKLLMLAGLRGGLCIFHPFGWKGEDVNGVKSMPEDALSNGLRWVIRPHVHAVGYGWLDGEIIAEIHAKYGIVIKCIASSTSDGKRLGSDDVTAILSYCLSHSGIGVPVNGRGRNLRALRDFGSLSGRSKSGIVRVDVLPESSPMTCPICEENVSEVSHLYDLHDYASSALASVPLRMSHRYGVYCPKSCASRVREDLASLSPLEIVQYARDNPDVCVTRCRDPDDPAGIRRNLSPFEIRALLGDQGDFRRAVFGDSGVGFDD